jgi:hypothetical protein
VEANEKRIQAEFRKYMSSINPPTNPHWARVVGYGPFSICVIHKVGLCPSSGDIRLMMMSSIIDKPKPGYDSTNNRNVTRKFIHNNQQSSSITGIYETLIQKLHIILHTISRGIKIDTNKFKSFYLNTAEFPRGVRDKIKV